jgi:hypothetical protein
LSASIEDGNSTPCGSQLVNSLSAKVISSRPPVSDVYQGSGLWRNSLGRLAFGLRRATALPRAERAGAHRRSTNRAQSYS